MGNKQTLKPKQESIDVVSGKYIKPIKNGYEYNNINDIILGYIKTNIKINIIKDIIDIIKLFIGNMDILFNVCQTNKDKKKRIINVIQNCNQIYINNIELHMIKNDKLFISEENNVEAVHHDFWDNKCIFVSTGMANEHVYIQCKNGLYSYGYNDYNQTSVLYMDFIWPPMTVDYKFDSKVCQIKCGWHHSLFLTENGNVYGCGDNTVGQLLNTFDRGNPDIQCIIDSMDIKYIDCCSFSSYIIDINDTLKSFGDNYFGQLGIKNNSIKKINSISFAKDKVSMISCGYAFIGYLTQDYNVYMFGYNECYNCGLNDKSACDDGNNIILNNNDKIISVKCGHNHTILKTESNKYYSFGNNSNKQLLINSIFKNISKPKLISNEYIHKLTKSNAIIMDILPLSIHSYIIQATF